MTVLLICSLLQTKSVFVYKKVHLIYKSIGVVNSKAGCNVELKILVIYVKVQKIFNDNWLFVKYY